MVDHPPLVLHTDLPAVEDDAEAYRAEIERRLSRLQTELDAMNTQVEQYTEAARNKYDAAHDEVLEKRETLRATLNALDAIDPEPSTIASIDAQLAALQQAYEMAWKTSEAGKRQLICKRLLYLFGFCRTAAQ